MDKATDISSQHREARLGLMYALAAFTAWGLFAIYFNAILTRGVSALTLVSHRIVWAVPFLLVIVLLQRKRRELLSCFKPGRTMLLLLGSTLMIGVNWFVFAYAIEHRQALQAGLGYYINPLVNVLLGAIVLHERLRPMQKLSVLLALIGVATQTYLVGTFQWIPLALAVSFAVYGLFRKTVSVGPLVGLTFETIALLPIALWLALRQLRIDLSTGESFPTTGYGLMLFSGIVTAMPLLWFAAGARRLRLSTIGFIQYIGPTLQTIVAVWYMHEPFAKTQLITFALIWIGLVIYTIDSWRALRQARADRAVVEAQKRFESAAACEQ